MGYFWTEDSFIDKEAKKLSLKAIAVYVCIKRHADKEGKCKIGVRKIAEEIGVNKDTASSAIDELQLSHMVGQRVNPLSRFGYYTVPVRRTELSESVGQKEYRNTYKGKETKSERTYDERRAYKENYKKLYGVYPI